MYRDNVSLWHCAKGKILHLGSQCLNIQNSGSQPVGYNLLGGPIPGILHIADVFIIIHNSGKITVTKKEQNNLMVGNCIKELQQ